MASALKAAKSPKAGKVLEKLTRFSKTDDRSNKWWGLSEDNNEKNVEITSYILIALLDTPGDYTDIVKWLIEQRNELGGFDTTHDTVVGLQALIKYYKSYEIINATQITLNYAAKDKEEIIVQKGVLEVNADNVEQLQLQEVTFLNINITRKICKTFKFILQLQLPKTTRQLTIELKGFGHILVQLYYQYNTLNDIQQSENIILQPRSMNALELAPKLHNFLIKPQVHILSSYLMNLEVCFTYQSPGHQHMNTNMVILEVNLPSGFRSNAENSEALIENDLIERIESKNDDTLFVLYIGGLSVNGSHCVDIECQKLNDVINLQPVAITMYDYYNTSRSDTIFYNIE